MFYLFAGKNNTNHAHDFSAPAGGMGDYVGVFDTVAKASEYYKLQTKILGWNWADIAFVDPHTHELTLYGFINDFGSSDTLAKEDL